MVVNVLRDGIPAPIPYAANLFDYGRNKMPAGLPINLGFAGFRLRFPLNAPHVRDEVIAFLGASYFRFLGRGQRYGLSARGLAIGAGARGGEEFPVLSRVLDRDARRHGPSASSFRRCSTANRSTGALRFEIAPAVETSVDVAATSVRAPSAIAALGKAPLSSMFLNGKNDHRVADDFRARDSRFGRPAHAHRRGRVDLAAARATPLAPAVSTFLDDNPRGFGLVQRDRIFDHYQDLDLAYKLRPSYWVEPHGDWGEGGVELAELPTDNESNDNIVAAWTPKETFKADAR